MRRFLSLAMVRLVSASRTELPIKENSYAAPAATLKNKSSLRAR